MTFSKNVKAAAAALASFLAALSLWSLVYDVASFPREALLAVRAEELLALCRTEGTPLSELLERVRTAGATAVLVRDQTWAEAADEGRVHYVSRGQAAAFKALGLVDPTAPVPEDALWLGEGEGLDPAARILRDSGVRFSTAAFEGRAILKFSEGLDLDQHRAGPSPALIAAARAAELLPVYTLERWDRNAAAILSAASDRPDFPRAAYAPMPRKERELFASAAERRILDEGLFLPPGPRGLAARFNAWTAADFRAGVPAARIHAALEDARPRLVVQGIDPKAGAEAALIAVRDASEMMAAEGMRRTADLHDFKETRWAPPELSLLRRLVTLLLAVLLPFVCAALGLRAVLRALESTRWPLAAPVWQLGAGIGAVAGAALSGGILVDGLLGLQRPLLARALLYAPFLVGAGWWYRHRRPALGRRLERPLTVKGLAGLVAGLAALWLVWGCARTNALAAADLASHWRSILLGGPALIGAFWIRCRRHAGLKGLMEDERPLLVLGLWLPIEMIGAFVLSSASFWVAAERALFFAFSSLAVGGVLLAGLSYYELRVRPWAIHSRWI